MVKLIGFDLDGTIGDTLPFSMEAFRRAVSPYIGHVISDAEIIETFGLNETGMIKKAVKDHWEDALKDFYIQYCNLHEQCPSPYEGIRHLLFFLQERGIKIALITGKGKKACDITLEKFGLRNIFCDIETGREDKPNKVQAMKKLLEKYQLKPEEFVYVGDAVSDVEASSQTGIVCLSAAWGKTAETQKLEKANPGYVFYTVEQLTKICRRLNAGDCDNCIECGEIKRNNC